MSTQQPATQTARVTPEAFGEATKTGLSAINSTALATCTLVGAGLSLYADLSHGLLPEIAGWVALAAWLSSLTLALFLAGRSAGAIGLRASVLRGATMARGNFGFTVVVLLLTAGAAFSAWSRAVADRGGVLASLASKIDRIQGDTAEIKASVTREVLPAESLARLGYTSSPEDICRAITQGQLEALRLIAKLGASAARISVPQGAGYYTLCLESMLLSAQSKLSLVQVAAILPIPAADLNRLHSSEQFGNKDAGPIRLAPLMKAVGLSHNADVQLYVVDASALMFAVWGDNLSAVQALLQLGADPNQGAKLVVGGGGVGFFGLKITPLVEARRLGRASLVEALAAAGGRMAVTKEPSF